MTESKMADIIKASVDGIKNFADMESAVGTPIHTANGVTVIPVSRVAIGFATGGLDYSTKRLSQNQNFGGGGGTGVSITPLAFLVVGKDAEVNLIRINDSADATVDKFLSVVERSPEIIKKIKDTLT